MGVSWLEPQVRSSSQDSRSDSRAVSRLRHRYRFCSPSLDLTTGISPKHSPAIWVLTRSTHPSYLNFAPPITQTLSYSLLFQFAAVYPICYPVRRVAAVAMSAASAALGSQVASKDRNDVYAGKATSQGRSPAGHSGNGQSRQEVANAPSSSLGVRAVLQHQLSCPSSTSSKKEPGPGEDPYADGYSNSTPCSPFQLSLDDEFPDFLFDNINDEYASNGSRTSSVSQGGRVVALEDILRDYSPSSNAEVAGKGYGAASYNQQRVAAQGSDVSSQEHLHRVREGEDGQRLSQPTRSIPSRPPVPSNVSRSNVSPQSMAGQRTQTCQEGDSLAQDRVQPNSRNLRPGSMSPQQVMASNIGLSPPHGMPSSSVVSPQQRFPAQQVASPARMPPALSPRPNTSAVSPQNPYPPQQGMPAQQYGQMLATLAARQGAQPAGVPSGSINLQDIGSPEPPKSRSPGPYLYRSHSQESPQGSPIPPQPAQGVFKVPHGTPPMPRRNQKVIQESVNSPSYALQFQDMSLNSPRPRSDTVEMGAAPEDGYDGRVEGSLEVGGKNGFVPGHAQGGLSPPLNDVPQRLRSGTIEMSDSNGAATSSYSSSSSAAVPVETRSRAGTFDMLDVPGDNVYGNNYASSVVEQRARSGTVEMSDESPVRATQYALPTLPSPRSMPSSPYVQPPPVSRSNVPLPTYSTSSLASGPDPSQVSMYPSSPTDPSLLPPQVMRVRQQASPGYMGAPGAAKILSHVGSPPGDMRLYEKQVAAQQMFAQHRLLQNSDPGTVDGRSIPVLRHGDPAVLQNEQNQHYLQQQQQHQYMQQQMTQSRFLQQQHQRQQQQQRILLHQAQQQYKHELEVEQEVAQEFLQEQLLKEGVGDSSLGNELDNLESTELFGYVNSKLEQKRDANVAADFKLRADASSSSMYLTRQSYMYGMPGASSGPPPHESIIIMPDGSGFSSPGQYISDSGLPLLDKENYASPIPSLLEQPQSKQETPFQRLRRIAEDISSCVDDVVKFKGKKDEPEYKYLEETLQRQLLLLDEVQTSSGDLQSARKALIKEVQELLDILERRAT